MKAVLPLVLVTAGLLGSSLAENLLVNGDFETGALAPWTGPGNVAEGQAGAVGFVCYVLETTAVEQTVATKPGARYYLAADLYLNTNGTGTVSAVRSAGGSSDGAFTVSGPTVSPGLRKSVAFTASTSSTRIVLQVGAPSPLSAIERGGSGPVFFDNVVLYELSPSTLAGRYRGLVTSTLTVEKPAAVNRTSRKVTARITREGRIVILDGTTNIYAGQIFNDGIFDLGVGVNVFGAVRRAQGKATLTAQGLQLTLPGATLPAIDEGSTPVKNEVTNEIILTRVEP